MQIEVRIITRDYELGLRLFDTRRFPSRYPKAVPGEAVVSSQSLTENEESMEWTEIIDLVVDFDENCSVEMFANWLYGKLTVKPDDVYSLTIAGTTVEFDEAEIAHAVEEGLKR
ncbi:MAG: hypothetical protein A2074_00200 [Candidatus Aquicultor primus]|uniref:Uncharacterized protein n=1 Tax=Candidatus Aquicultor primus TaxID=1797195 RepID=A0A1F2UHP3_9ACTN|nr:MAG: hypothetical protein A2074_00200 [Candidatus Aquicultor primus]